MKNLKKLGLSVTLILVLALAAFAGETNSPPCAPAPGITETPPCASAPAISGGYIAPGETSSLPGSNAGSEYSVADVTIVLLQSVLALF